jgi:hypothetical protein
MHLHQAIVAKLTVKKIQSIVDHMQIITTHQMADHPMVMVLQEWCDEARLHLRKLEHSVEASAE